MGVRPSPKVGDVAARILLDPALTDLSHLLSASRFTVLDRRVCEAGLVAATADSWTPADRVDRAGVARQEALGGVLILHRGTPRTAPPAGNGWNRSVPGKTTRYDSIRATFPKCRG